MLYAEYESYHFLSISLTAYIHKAKSHDRIRVVCRGKKMKCHCIRQPQTKCRNRLKNWECLLLLYEIIRWENVNQKEECQQYFALRLFFLIYPENVSWAYKLFPRNTLPTIHFTTTTIVFKIEVQLPFLFTPSNNMP